MRATYFWGIVVSSLITSMLLYLPFSGLLGMFFILGILFALSMYIPGALLAGLLANTPAGGALAGAVTGLLGDLLMLTNVPVLRPPFLPIGQVVLNALLPLPVTLVVGGIAGYNRKFRLGYHPFIDSLKLSLAVMFMCVLLLPLLIQL